MHQHLVSTPCISTLQRHLGSYMKLHEGAGSYIQVYDVACITGPYAICSMHYACTMQAWQTVSGLLSPHLTWITETQQGQELNPGTDKGRLGGRTKM